MRFAWYCLFCVVMCKACPSGSYVNPVNASACLTCAPGTQWTSAPIVACKSSVWLYRNSSTQYYLNLLTPGISEFNNNPYRSNEPDTFTTWTKVRFTTVLSRWNASNIRLSTLLTDNPLFATDSPSGTTYLFPFASATESSGTTYASMTGNLVGTPFAFSPGAFVCGGYQYTCIGPTFSNGNQTVSGSVHGNGGSLVFYGALTLFNSTQYQTDLAQACGLYPNDTALACFGNETACNTPCQPCGIGMYSSAAGSVNCTVCPAGQYGTGYGATVCAVCGAGTYASGMGSSFCGTCQAGTYASGTGMTACLVCGSVTYSTYSDPSACVVMVVRGSFFCNIYYILVISQSLGTYPGAAPYYIANATCVPCPVGQFSNVVMTSAQLCSTCGGANQCQTCGSGTYASGLALSACSTCAAGSYSTTQGASVCTLCAPGNFLSSPVSTACSVCQAGSYTSGSGVTICSTCGAGTYSTTQGSSVCALCAPGNFQSSPASTGCAGCPVGSYAPGSGSSGCRPCAMGSYQNSSNATTCLVCPVGTWGNVTNQTSLAAACPNSCPSGTWGTTTGQSSQSGACGQSCAAGTALNTWQPDQSNNLPTSSGGARVSGTCAWQTYVCQMQYYLDTTNNVVTRVVSSCCNVFGQIVSTFTISSQSPVYYGGVVPGSFNANLSVVDGFSAMSWQYYHGFYVVDFEARIYVVKPDGPVFTSVALESVPNATGPASRYFISGFYGARGADLVPVYIFWNQLCPLCPAGTFQSSPAATACNACAPGFYASGSGSTVCAACAAGYYVGSNQSTACLACLAGTYASAPASSICTLCPAGAGYSLASNATACAACDACGDGQWTALACTPVSDTVCAACADCVLGEYRVAECVLGAPAEQV